LGRIDVSRCAAVRAQSFADHNFCLTETAETAELGGMGVEGTDIGDWSLVDFWRVKSGTPFKCTTVPVGVVGGCK